MDKKTIYAMKNAFDEIVKIIQEEAVELNCSPSSRQLKK